MCIRDRLEIGTDKVDSEIPSSAAGIVIEILAKPNDIIEVGEVIARIDTDSDGNVVTDKPFEQKTVKTKNVEKESLPPEPSSSRSKTEIYNSPNKKIFYTPVVMKIASEKEIPFNELESIQGSGRGGRITKKDILQYAENKTSSVSCLLYTSPSPRDATLSRMPSSA